MNLKEFLIEYGTKNTNLSIGYNSKDKLIGKNIDISYKYMLNNYTYINYYESVSINSSFLYNGCILLSQSLDDTPFYYAIHFFLDENFNYKNVKGNECLENNIKKVYIKKVFNEAMIFLNNLKEKINFTEKLEKYLNNKKNITKRDKI